VYDEVESEIDRDGHSSLTLHVPAEPPASRAVRDAVSAFGRQSGLEESDLEFILTALGEAVANAIEHSGTTEPIEVCCVARPDKFLATVRDFGRGLSDAAIAAEIPPLLRERGRGLPIMRTCSDLFSVRNMPGGGAIVVVGRYVRAGRQATKRRAFGRGGFLDQHPSATPQ
jgi:anti-sigma regulatory factor (Ser/Thr protein kinase)